MRGHGSSGVAGAPRQDADFHRAAADGMAADSREIRQVNPLRDGRSSMRLLKILGMAALCTGLLSASVANAQRLEGGFGLIDQNDPNGNFATFVVVGTTAYLQGAVEGTGTAGDEVLLGYFTDTPTHLSANAKQARIRQSDFAGLGVLIDSATPARDLDWSVHPQKCRIDGKVQAEKGNGDVTVKCSADDLFEDVTADQLASIQAAFLDTKQVKIKVKSGSSKGSITIKLKGTADEIKP
jgi:hypothetical protein